MKLQLAHCLDFSDMNERTSNPARFYIDHPRRSCLGVKPRSSHYGCPRSITAGFVGSYDLEIRAIGLRQEVRAVIRCVRWDRVIADDGVAVLPCEVHGGGKLVVEQERRIESATIGGRAAGNERKDQTCEKRTHWDLPVSNHPFTIRRLHRECQRNEHSVS